MASTLNMTSSSSCFSRDNNKDVRKDDDNRITRKQTYPPNVVESLPFERRQVYPVSGSYLLYSKMTADKARRGQRQEDSLDDNERQCWWKPREGRSGIQGRHCSAFWCCLQNLLLWRWSYFYSGVFSWFSIMFFSFIASLHCFHFFVGVNGTLGGDICRYPCQDKKADQPSLSLPGR